MNCEEQCFGCHGLYDVDDDIASSRRSSLDALVEDPDVEKLDISTIRDFYKQLTCGKVSQKFPQNPTQKLVEIFRPALLKTCLHSLM
jgi:hypothetical protein